jgi:hypothetical protein
MTLRSLSIAGHPMVLKNAIDSLFMNSLKNYSIRKQLRFKTLRIVKGHWKSHFCHRKMAIIESDMTKEESPRTVAAALLGPEKFSLREKKNQRSL